MSICGKIISAPLRLVEAVAATANVVTEKTIGVDLDIFDIEGEAKALAEEIEERTE